MGKKIWQSKVFYVNILALGGMIYQMISGSEVGLSIEIQGTVLAVINLILRSITKEPISW